MRFRPTTILSIFAVVAMCLVIFAMSAQTADKSTELSMGIVWHIIGFIVPGYDQMSPADQLYWQQLLDHPVRKTAHFLEYALLGVLTMNMVVRIARDRYAGDAGAGAPAPAGSAPAAGMPAGGDAVGRQPAPAGRAPAAGMPALRQLGLVAWALATGYAAGDEIHQVFVPGRAFMFTDILIDSGGILVGVLLAALLFKRASTRNRDRA